MSFVFEGIIVVVELTELFYVLFCDHEDFKGVGLLFLGLASWLGLFLAIFYDLYVEACTRRASLATAHRDRIGRDIVTGLIITPSSSLLADEVKHQPNQQNLASASPCSVSITHRNRYSSGISNAHD